MDVNKESHFFETASIFEENWIERNTVNALRNHATGVGMGVLVQMDDRVIGVDAYNFNITGDIACTLNATSCDSPSHSGPSVIVRQEVQMDVMGVDCYNLCGTGSIGRTLATSSGGLNEHIPVVCHEVQMDSGVIGIDLYNQSVTGAVSKALNSAATDSDHIPVVIVLNDQGGSVMDISNDVTATLRAQDHGHPPVVCFVPEQNHCATYREDKVSATLQTGYHFGGGGDAALILEKHEMPVVSIEGNGARPSHRGVGYSEDGRMFTLNTIEKHAVCYAIEGNVVDRISAKNGKGWCEDVSPTLNTQDKHAVCFPVESIGHDIRSTQFSRGGCCDTMTASDYKDPIIVCYDARGNGGGGVTPTITGDHQNRVTDYTAVVALALGATDANGLNPTGYQGDDVVLVFKERAGKPGGGKGILIGEDKSFTLATQMIDALCYQNSTGVKE